MFLSQKSYPCLLSLTKSIATKFHSLVSAQSPLSCVAPAKHVKSKTKRDKALFFNMLMSKSMMCYWRKTIKQNQTITIIIVLITIVIIAIIIVMTKPCKCHKSTCNIHSCTALVPKKLWSAASWSAVSFFFGWYEEKRSFSAASWMVLKALETKRKLQKWEDPMMRRWSTWKSP